MKHTQRIKDQINEGNRSDKSWFRRHALAMLPQSNPVSSLIHSLAWYADDYEERFEQGIGQDGYLGDVWRNMVQGCRDLLNGECGGLDCGKCDSLLCEMLESEGYDA